MRGIQRSGQRWANWFPWSPSSQCESDARRVEENDDEVKNEAVKTVASGQWSESDLKNIYGKSGDIWVKKMPRKADALVIFVDVNSFIDKDS
jgi:hypothetical protein